MHIDIFAILMCDIPHHQNIFNSWEWVLFQEIIWLCYNGLNGEIMANIQAMY